MTPFSGPAYSGSFAGREGCAGAQSFVRISVIIPAYNEAERIVPTLDTILAFFADWPDHEPEVLIVSDGSTDETAAIGEHYAAAHAGVRTIAYRPNRGKGYAVRRGMLEASGDVALLCDADLSTPISELPRFLEFQNGRPRVVVASRALPSASIGGWRPASRTWAGIAFNRFVQHAAVPGCWDTQCGFKLFPGPAAAPLFGRCLCDGFSYDVEVLVIARHLGFDIVELGVPWDNDPATKVRISRDLIPSARDVLLIAARRRRGYYDRANGDV